MQSVIDDQGLIDVEKVGNTTKYHYQTSIFLFKSIMYNIVAFWMVHMVYCIRWAYFTIFSLLLLCDNLSQLYLWNSIIFLRHIECLLGISIKGISVGKQNTKTLASKSYRRYDFVHLIYMIWLYLILYYAYTYILI